MFSSFVIFISSLSHKEVFCANIIHQKYKPVFLILFLSPPFIISSLHILTCVPLSPETMYSRILFTNGIGAYSKVHRKKEDAQRAEKWIRERFSCPLLCPWFVRCEPTGTRSASTRHHDSDAIARYHSRNRLQELARSDTHLLGRFQQKDRWQAKPCRKAVRSR